MAPHPFAPGLRDRLSFALNRLREKLWVRPLSFCLVSLIGVGLAHLADQLIPAARLPDVSAGTLETLLRIITSSMLVIAVFAAGSMLSAYASASSVATPRAFELVVADDISQFALSTFIGAFIFGVVALTAVVNGVMGRSGRLALFLLTVGVFAIVVLSFVTWVDRIARLGRVTTTIARVEKAAALALLERGWHPTLRARPFASPAGSQAESKTPPPDLTLCAEEVGYVQRIDLAALQQTAEQFDLEVMICSHAGAFITPQRVLAHAFGRVPADPEARAELLAAFRIGSRRTFDDDPRFGLVVLSEIASRALSPAVNDPGTAIQIITALVRLFTRWAAAREQSGQQREEAPLFPRIRLPELALEDLLDDAFQAIGRDGAACVEVGLRLQKGLAVISALPVPGIEAAARAQARLALHHSERGLRLAQDVERLRRAAGWVLEGS
jgi:uncharacterized membrane protein